MRYIGNKTRLLPFIARAIRQLRIPPGSAHDAFAGTAAVGRALAEAGWRVASSDLMTYSYVFQRAYVVARREPRFAALRARDPDLRRALRSPELRRRAEARGGRMLDMVAEYLDGWLEPEQGFIAGHFAPAGGRMYFTDANAERIDAVRHALHRWREGGLLPDDAYYLLLASLIEGADRVANTAGVYAAYIKSWQPNARQPMRLDPVSPVAARAGAVVSSGSRAYLGDAAAVAGRLGPVDLLYVDPPYNARQYPGYYHIPEIIARGWFDGPPALLGKTGLLGDATQRSAWCSTRRVRPALAELLGATRARHVLVSYNSEGLLPEPELVDALRAASTDGRCRRFVQQYRRYRSDRDHAKRRYRGDLVRELLYYVRLR